MRTQTLWSPAWSQQPWQPQGTVQKADHWVPSRLWDLRTIQLSNKPWRLYRQQGWGSPACYPYLGKFHRLWWIVLFSSLAMVFFRGPRCGWKAGGTLIIRTIIHQPEHYAAVDWTPVDSALITMEDQWGATEDIVCSFTPACQCGIFTGKLKVTGRQG